MKLLFFSTIAIVAVVCFFSFDLQKSRVATSTISVIGKSQTGYSWARTYTGPQMKIDFVVEALQESYVRLAESMGAGSALKIFVDGALVYDEKYPGAQKAAFSGMQIFIHDKFAAQNSFYTPLSVPQQLKDMDEIKEPFMCGHEQ